MGSLEARDVFRTHGKGRLKLQPLNGSNHSPRAAGRNERDGETGRTGAGTAENNFGP